MKKKFKILIAYLLIFTTISTNINIFGDDRADTSYNSLSATSEYDDYQIIEAEQDLIEYIINQDREGNSSFKILYLIEPSEENIKYIEKLFYTMSDGFYATNTNNLALSLFFTSYNYIHKATYEGQECMEIVFYPHAKSLHSKYINIDGVPSIDNVEEFKDYVRESILTKQEDFCVIMNVPFTTNNIFKVYEIFHGWCLNKLFGDEYYDCFVTSQGITINPVVINDEYAMHVRIQFSYSDLYMYQEELDKEIKEILSKIITDDMYTHEKVKAIHDYIVKNYKYDLSYEVCYPQEMLDKGCGVCQAYALLTYKMLSLANIPVKLVTGTADNGIEAG